MITVHGVPLSPFVRKVLLTLDYKGIEYNNVPVFPGSDDPDFRAMSPLGKVPALDHDGFVLADSSIICRYLDRVFPEKPVYPEDAQTEARMTWLEEFADSKLIEALAGLFQQRFLFPKMMGQATDESIVSNILDNQLPPLLSYLESVTPETGLMSGAGVSIADIAIGTCFLQGQYGEFAVDAERYPRLASYLDTILNAEVVKARMAAEAEVVKQMAS